MTLICAKFDADLINISKVTSRKTKWPGFLAYPVECSLWIKRYSEHYRKLFCSPVILHQYHILHPDIESSNSKNFQ